MIWDGFTSQNMVFDMFLQSDKSHDRVYPDQLNIVDQFVTRVSVGFVVIQSMKLDRMFEGTI